MDRRNAQREPTARTCAAGTRAKTGTSRSNRPTAYLRITGLWLVCIVVCQFGCISSQQQALFNASTLARLSRTEQIVDVQRLQPDRPLAKWKRWWGGAEPPSPRTALLLRRYNLETKYQESPDEVIGWLHQLTETRPSLEAVHALAELAEKQAQWSQESGDQGRAHRLYAVAIIHAYQFLFDRDLNITRNAYDPQFRSICDIYNRSLEELLRPVLTDKNFGSGYQVALGAGQSGIQLQVEIEGRWRDQSIDRFELVSDYAITGFENEHRTYGLGAPLIAVRTNPAESSQKPNRQLAGHFPPELTIPMTAFLHLPPKSNNSGNTDPSAARDPQTAVLTLYDPLEKTTVRTEGKTIPLQSDITAPLAYGLQDPLLNKGILATASLLNGDFAPEAYGIFMIEPYDPTKIPVVMVHGLWDAPGTWAHMINDLRANGDLHKNYQFWFYSYPTAQPFWTSARKFRNDLHAIQAEIAATYPDSGRAMDQMVLVGHSMGGLLSTLQTVNSQNRFWQIVSGGSIDSLRGTPQILQDVRDTFYFRPNASVKKVVTIATPFGGSDFSNPTTRWLSKRLINLPSTTITDFEKLAAGNQSLITNPTFLTRLNSIDSLAPDNPFLNELEASHLATGVQLHTIIGRLEKSGLFGRPSATSAAAGDGVVAVASALRSDATSNVFVAAEHTKLHQHPGCILEVRRILLEHLAEIDRGRANPVWQQSLADIYPNSN